MFYFFNSQVLMLENTKDELQTRLDAQSEWLLIRASGRSFALQNREIELEQLSDKLLFGFLDDGGFQTWRVTDCKFESDGIYLRLSRNFNQETEKIRLVARVSAKELSENVELARLEKANRIAALITQTFPRAKLSSVKLNEENGRFAQIIFADANNRQVAALADVSDTLTPENLVSTAILWLAKLENRRKKPIETIWILSEKKQSKNLQKLCALLHENWKRRIFIVEISREGAKARRKKESKKESEKESEYREIKNDESSGAANLIELPQMEIENLRRGKTSEIKTLEVAQLSETADAIVRLAPAEIDVVRSKHGETARFLGLSFARVRKVFDREKIWFGVERDRTILSESNQDNFADLVENLHIYRRPNSPNRKHAFYTLAPEAWLEAILRRNINLLDSNLILSPVYHQFRTGRDKIDLLALRKDGRLIVIELKVAADQAMIFQAADYWRKIELQRRRGNLRKARIFGDLEIADKPGIVYLVAPTLCFHQSFEFLASTITPEIKIHRFNLAENWRENLKVLERKKI
jgi:hypothetical protein